MFAASRQSCLARGCSSELDSSAREPWSEGWGLDGTAMGFGFDLLHSPRPLLPGGGLIWLLSGAFVSLSASSAVRQRLGKTEGRHLRLTLRPNSVCVLTRESVTPHSLADQSRAHNDTILSSYLSGEVFVGLGFLLFLFCFGLVFVIILFP